MSATIFPTCWCSVLTVLLCMANICNSEKDASDFTGSALTACLNDQHVYSSSSSNCQEFYKLSTEGSLDVPPEAADDYCRGPCLSRTKLLLDCLNNATHGVFRFDNSASVQDIRHAMNRACSNGSHTGDFNSLHHWIDGTDEEVVYGHHPYQYGDYCDDGSRLQSISFHLLLLLLFFFTCVLPFWS